MKSEVDQPSGSLSALDHNPSMMETHGGDLQGSRGGAVAAPNAECQFSTSGHA